MSIAAALYLSMNEFNLISNIEIMHVLSQQMINIRYQMVRVYLYLQVFIIKKTLTSTEGKITEADHDDFTKLSLTPSVTLFVNIPDNISESFYDGKVYVCYKDTVFQPSSALRNSTEFFNLVNQQYQNQPLPSILSLYTDGSPDHRCTFGSVQVALICLFLASDFDMLIAVRTVPHHS
ncbi:hypothetical protein GLOIN_2v1779779 [Rhizophagus irregularis DAOM 181602=DAOM 197198]|nr:hypothetical protein GLOIN_2v1779779 [Rhizophagus irregularis DAOM 181602=DAOM 197198]